MRSVYTLEVKLMLLAAILSTFGLTTLGLIWLFS